MTQWLCIQEQDVLQFYKIWFVRKELTIRCYYGVALQVVFSWGPGSSSTMAVTYLATSQAFFSIQMASLSFTSVSTLHLWGHQRTWNTPIPFTSWHLILYVLMHLFSQPCFNCAECPEAWWFLLNTGPWWLYSCNFNILKCTSMLLTLTPGPASVVLRMLQQILGYSYGLNH